MHSGAPTIVPNFAVLPLEVFSDARLSARDIRVLGALYAHNSGAGIVFPARKTIARMTGLTETKVSASTTRLARLGWLAKKPGHRGRVTEYQLRVPVPGTLSSGKGASSGNPIAQKGCPKVDEKGASSGNPEISMEVIKHKGSGDGKGNGIELPPWLPSALWAEFRAHRKSMRAPMTPEAERRNLAKLERLRSAGHDPESVIGQSIENGWKGLFGVKLKATLDINPAVSTAPVRKLLA